MTDIEKAVFAHVYSHCWCEGLVDVAAERAEAAVRDLREESRSPIMDEVLNRAECKCGGCGKPIREKPKYSEWDHAYCSRECLLRSIR